MADIKETYRKALHYCTYRERSQQEVRDKLYEWHLRSNDVENMIADLISAGFLNEERFARAYCGGKFRINGWGKNKIRNGLIQKKVSPKCIELGLSEISEKDYNMELKKILSAKLKGVSKKELMQQRHKAARFAIGKGYESEKVWSILSEKE